MIRALVIDAEADVQRLLEQRFHCETCGKVLAFAFSDGEALAYLEQEPPYPEVILILSDRNTPGKSGLELQPPSIRLGHPKPLQVMTTLKATRRPGSWAPTIP